MKPTGRKTTQARAHGGEERPKHRSDPADVAFRRQVEGGDFPVADFDHCAHVRLAYIYLVDSPVDEAVTAMRETLFGLLEQAGIDPATKYHETLTRAWLLAVSRFMARSRRCGSARVFIDRHPELLDVKLLNAHYSPALLFSDAARDTFVAPDLAPFGEP